MIQLGVALATALEFAGLFVSPQTEQDKVSELKKLEAQNNVVVSDLIKRGSSSVSTSSPRTVAPRVLLGMGRAVEGCSSSTALEFGLRAFEGARALPDGSPKEEGVERGLNIDEPVNQEIRATKRSTFVGVIAWLSSSSIRRGRPDLLALAQDLAGQIDYGTGIVKRQEVPWHTGAAMMGKPVGLEARLAEHIVGTAMCWLNPTYGNKILCTKAALKQAIRAALDEAYEAGFLAGQKVQYSELTRPGSPDRPAWMDIRLDDPDDLARNHIRFQPVVLRSLLDADYRRLGDLRWVPSRELMFLRYVGFKWARQIRAVVRRFERDAEATPEVTP